MKPRIKKLIGILILLVGMFVYFIAAINIADALPDHIVLQIGYYAIAGIIWVFPLKPLFLWINKEPTSGDE